jgi:integrase
MAVRIKIGKRTVDALEVTGARYVAWDTEIPGFGVRIGPTGTRTYVLKYRVGGGRSGRDRWGILGRHGSITPEQARDRARLWTAEVVAGGDPAGDRIEKRKAPTVAELVSEYLEKHVQVHNKPSTRAYVEDLARRLILPDAIARVKVSDVTEADLARFLGRLASTPTTANRVRSALSKAFSLAETWGYRAKGTNPCREAPKHQERARERFLSPAEVSRLGEVLARAERGELTLERGGKPRLVFVSSAAIAAIRLLLFTGARRGEILGLRWEMIDLAAGVARLPDSKSGAKSIMLPPGACSVLEGIGRPESGRGFVIRGGDHTDPETPLVNLKDSWSVLREAAGLEGVRMHDLRHTFASLLVANGYSLPVIGRLLGHSSPATTARYAHLADDPLKAASKHAGAVLDAQLKGQGKAESVVPMLRKH